MENKGKKIGFLLIILVGTMGVLGYFYWSQLRNLLKMYPSCDTTTPFTHMPMDYDRLLMIAPLGNLNPPGHTYPTDHMYFYTNMTRWPNGFDIFAPGRIFITGLEQINYQNTYSNISQDYTIDFIACKEVSGRFGHVNNLSANLWTEIKGFGTDYGDKKTSWQVANSNQTAFQKATNLEVPVGYLLGIAGLGGGYDFWLKDSRVKLSWINESLALGMQNTVCPLTYFTDEIRVQLEAKVQEFNGKKIPSGTPYCGKIDYDVQGSAQGIWTVDWYQTKPNLRAEDMGLALVYSNFNASMGVISIGDIDKNWSSKTYMFTPESIGKRNRAFAQVQDIGQIFYYFYYTYDGYNYNFVQDKAILIKFINDRQLRLQFIDNLGIPLPADPSSLWNDANSEFFIR